MDKEYASISWGMVAIVSGIVLVDLVLAARRLYLHGGGWQIVLSSLTVLAGVLGAWGYAYRQHTQAKQLADRKLATRISTTEFSTVLCANLCVLGALGLLSR